MLRPNLVAVTLFLGIVMGAFAVARADEVVIEVGTYEGNSYTIARNVGGPTGDLVLLVPPVVDFFENDPDADDRIVEEHRYLAELGHAVASLDFRNHPGLRLRERVTEMHEFGLYLRGRYGLDGDVFLAGARGTGPFVHLSMRLHPDSYAAAVAHGGFTDILGQLDYLEYSLLVRAWSFQDIGVTLESLLLLQDLLDGPARSRDTLLPSPVIDQVSPLAGAGSARKPVILVHGDSDLLHPIFHLWKLTNAATTAGTLDNFIALAVPAGGEGAPGGDVVQEYGDPILEAIAWAKQGSPPHYTPGGVYGPRETTDEVVPRKEDISDVEPIQVLVNPLLVQQQAMAGQGSHLGGLQGAVGVIDFDGDGLDDFVFGNAEGFVEVFGASTGAPRRIARSRDLGSMSTPLAIGTLGDGAEPKIVVGTWTGEIRVLSTSADDSLVAEGIYHDPLGAPILDVHLLPEQEEHGPTILYRSLDGFLIRLDPATWTEVARSPWIGSTPGTGMDVADLDGDGSEEIVVGTGRGIVKSFRASDLSPIAESDPLGFHPWRVHCIEMPNGAGRSILVNGSDDWGSEAGVSVVLRPNLTEIKRTRRLGSYRGFAASDLDGEGCDDLLLGGTGRVLAIDLVARRERIASLADPRARVTALACGNFTGDAGREIVALTREGTIDILDAATLEPIARSSGMAGAYGIAVLEIGADGPPSEIVVGTRSSGLQALEGNGLRPVVAFDVPDGWAHAIAAADGDGDGRPDLVVGSGEGIRESVEDFEGFLHVVDRHGGVVWSTEESTLPGNGADGSIWGLALCDLDGDGIDEIILGNDATPNHAANGPKVRRARIAVVDVFSRSRIATLELEAHDLFGLAARDVDGNGSPDIVVGDRRGYVRFVRFDPSSGDLDEFHVSEDLGSGLVGLTVSDLDGTGNPEILCGLEDGHVEILRWQEGELVPVRRTPDLGSHAWGIETADFDGDGSPEVVVGTGGGELFVFSSEMNLLHRLSDLGSLAGAYGAFEIADVDDDGVAELCVGSSGYLHVFDLRPAFTPGGPGGAQGGGLPTGYAHGFPPDQDD
jgi:hypothetical protein